MPHLQLLQLISALVIGKALMRRKVQWIGEGGAALVLGAAVGGLLRLSGVGMRFGQRLSFKVGLGPPASLLL